MGFAIGFRCATVAAVLTVGAVLSCSAETAAADGLAELDALMEQLQAAAKGLQVDAGHEAVIRKALTPPPLPPAKQEPPPAGTRPSRSAPPRVQPGWLQKEAPPPATPPPLSTEVAFREDLAIQTMGTPVEVMIGPSDRLSEAVLHLLCKGEDAHVGVRFEGRWMAMGRAGAITTTFGEGVYLKNIKRDGAHCRACSHEPRPRTSPPIRLTHVRGAACGNSGNSRRSSRSAAFSSCAVNSICAAHGAFDARVPAPRHQRQLGIGPGQGRRRPNARTHVARTAGNAAAAISHPMRYTL